MAFGFGFNKQKVLSAAEKFVQQGKLQNAIAEYEKVLKADPKDLTVSNTVGDLYSRLGESDKAVECFKNVGDAYATQGFTVKAIAMYKKLSKLKPSVESVLRLAELYTQQGLFNDARAQYLQVAEEFLRAGELEQAVRIFQKTLEMDPENAAMRQRLAEVYVRLGKKDEAWQIYSGVAEGYRNKGQLEAAEEVLQRMLTMDPNNSYALLLRGRTALEAGNYPAAIENLEKLPDLDNQPEALKGLFQSYWQVGRLSDAGVLATKLLAVHNDVDAITQYAGALIAAGQYEEALGVYYQNSERLLAADSAKVLENVHSIIGHLSGNTAALETVLELLHKAGEASHLTEVYELLAHAYVQAEDLEKARDYYLKLIELEPENQLHAQNYQQVVDRIGGAVKSSGSQFITVEEGAVVVDEIEATAPFIEQQYPDEVAVAVRAALTDAELFLSYNMPAKALGPLLAILPQAPRDLRLNQRLAALHTRAGNFAAAAVCCRTLESLYRDSGEAGDALRYAELAGKYEDRAAAPIQTVQPPAPPKPAHAETVVAELPVVAAPPPAKEEPKAPETPVSTAAAPAADPQVAPITAAPHVPAQEITELAPPPAVASGIEPEPAKSEIDLSSEWEDTIVEEQPAPDTTPVLAAATTPVPDPAAIAEVVEEIRFYLTHQMLEQARGALGKLEALHPSDAVLSGIRGEIDGVELATTAVAPQEADAVEEISLDEEPDAITPGEAPLQAEEPPIPVETAPQPEAAQPQVQAEPAVSEVQVEAEAPVEAEEPVTAEVAQTAPQANQGGVLNDFVAELESSLGEDFLPEAQVHAASPAPAKQLEPEPKLSHARPSEEASDESLGDFVAELEASLGDNFLPGAPQPVEATSPAPHPQTQPVEVAHTAPAGVASAALPPVETHPTAMAAAASASSPQPGKPRVSSAPPSVDHSANIDLASMFGELKHELEEETAQADEDPETHYNLGVAFREMGLLDEAIGELQKVCQSVDRGHNFPHVMQTFTWLAQCFLDQGVPEAAIRWYEKALTLPNLDGETRTALHYELGSAYELAGDKAAALNHFTTVYGSNIDYRDVTERIKALKS
jgi:tetratricopeptide (TPR) repeat protein